MQVVVAYLDPSSGSMLVQLVVGGAAAAGVGLKMQWHRVKRALHLSKEPPSDSEKTPAVE
jgi:hypothetical protein